MDPDVVPGLDAGQQALHRQLAALIREEVLDLRVDLVQRLVSHRGLVLDVERLDLLGRRRLEVLADLLVDQLFFGDLLGFGFERQQSVRDHQVERLLPSIV